MHVASNVGIDAGVHDGFNFGMECWSGIRLGCWRHVGMNVGIVVWVDAGLNAGLNVGICLSRCWLKCG